MGGLFRLLVRRAGSEEAALSESSRVADMLGIISPDSSDERLSGLALCLRGESVDAVTRQLTWKDFEGFCSDVLRSKGFQVRENIHLRRPRAQIDLLGVSGRGTIAVDCKHWARAPGRRSLSSIVLAQKERARRLHDGLDLLDGIASVVVILVDGGERFVEGGAVVPIFTLGDFLDNIEACRGSLDWV